jgi:hypothetical protein
MNRSSLRFPRHTLPPLRDLADWIGHQDGNHVLGLRLAAPAEEILQAEPREPHAMGGTDRVTHHAQSLPAARLETDGLLVCELQACLRSLARLKDPLVAPVYEALCQALQAAVCAWRCSELGGISPAFPGLASRRRPYSAPLTPCLWSPP